MSGHQPFSRSETILVVDDDPILLQAFRTVLEGDGFTVVEATTGLEAVEAFQRSRPDLVLLDALLPEMDGFEACRRMRQLPDGDVTPILIITSYDTDQAVEQAFAAGATDYLPKPVRIAVLRHRIDRMVQAGRAEIAVRKSERRFRSLIENASDLLIVIDASERFRYASPGAGHATGYAVEDIQGKSCLDFAHPDDILGLRAALKTAIGEPGAGHPLPDFRVRHKDGVWHIYTGIITCLLNDPDLRGIVVNCHDITERKALEAQLLQSSKMEAVGRLAGGIAHDFNNLLTAIIGYSGKLSQHFPPEDPTHRFAQVIKEDAERAAVMVRQLLSFSRKQTLRTQTFELNAIVTDLRSLLERTLPKGTTITFDLSPEMCWVKAAPGQIDQMLMNLMLNAGDALRENGTVRIETAVTVIEAGGTNAVKPGRYVRLRISDDGRGMDETTKANLFEPFFTTKEVGRGIGLGLSIVYGVVTQNGGRIHVESAPGKGTTFEILLPLHAFETAVPTTPSRIASPATKPTILVVEDEPNVRDLIVEGLTGGGFNVLSAHDGADGLRLCETHPGHIDLILTDVVMPNLNGPDMIRQVIRRRPDLKVIYMTGYFAENATLRDELREWETLIEKPFELDALFSLIAERLHTISVV